jgi:Oxidoreductase family, NAD-binding Rossmann fold
MRPGDVAIVFTPDDSHAAIAGACLAAGLHTLVAKPLVKTLAEHRVLLSAARRHNSLVREYVQTDEATTHPGMCMYSRHACTCVAASGCGCSCGLFNNKQMPS